MNPINLFYRKLYRFIGLVFPLLVWLSSESFSSIICGLILGASIFFDIIRRRNHRLNEWWFHYVGMLWREEEKNRFSGTTFFIAGFFIVVILFPRNIAVAAMVFSVVEDSFSAVIGVMYGKIKIGRRSLEGTAAGFLVCLFAAFILMRSGLMINPAVLIAGAAAAAVVELVPSRLDDNLTIPVFSALVMFLLT